MADFEEMWTIEFAVARASSSTIAASPHASSGSGNATKIIRGGRFCPRTMHGPTKWHLTANAAAALVLAAELW